MATATKDPHGMFSGTHASYVAPNYGTFGLSAGDNAFFPLRAVFSSFRIPAARLSRRAALVA